MEEVCCCLKKAIYFPGKSRYNEKKDYKLFVKRLNMTNIGLGIAVIVLVIMSAVQEVAGFHFRNRIAGQNQGKNTMLIVCSIFNIIWPVCAGVKGMSILSFLSGLFLSFFISVFYMRKENSVWIRFFQMKFVVLTSVILILLGAACLFGTDIQQVSLIREVRFLVIIGAKAAELLHIIIYKKFFAEDFKKAEQDKKKMSVFQGFLLSCLAYIYVDGVLAIYDFGGDFVPALMISGNMLILVLMFLFYRFDYIMEEKECLEKEHQSLEEEKAREQWKAEQLKTMSEKDALTGAYSRRYAIQKIEELKKEKTSFVIAYIDMDKMKEVNDSMGHQAGDIYLKNFVKNFSGNLKKNDFIARIGGDEFIAVLYQCSVDEGKSRLEEISRQLPEYSFSYGISSEGKSVEAMIEEADNCMYHAKKRKRGYAR